MVGRGGLSVEGEMGGGIGDLFGEGLLWGKFGYLVVGVYVG